MTPIPPHLHNRLRALAARNRLALADVEHDFAYRAAVLEYDAGQTRDEAERMALEEMEAML